MNIFVSRRLIGVHGHGTSRSLSGGHAIAAWPTGCWHASPTPLDWRVQFVHRLQRALGMEELAYLEWTRSGRDVSGVNRLLAWCRVFVATWVVILAGLFFTLTASYNVRQLLEINFSKEFEWVAESRVRALQQELHRLFEGLRIYGPLIQIASSGGDVHYQTIRNGLDAHFPYLHRLYLLSFVSGSASLIQVPTVSDAPDSRLDAKSGNWLKHPDFGELFLKAARTGREVAGERIVLAEQKREHGFPVVIPIGQMSHVIDTGTDASGTVTGFVLAIVDIDKLVSSSLGLLEPRGIDVVIHDDSARAQEGNLEVYTSRLSSRRNVSSSLSASDAVVRQEHPFLQRVRVVEVADRSWKVFCIAIQEFRSAEAFRGGHWIVLIGGIVFTMLLATYVHRGKLTFLYRERMEREHLRNVHLASIGLISMSVAHEINNPNHAILMNASHLLDVWQDVIPVLDEYSRENGDFSLGKHSYRTWHAHPEKMIRRIVQNCERIRQIVVNLKSMGRCDQGNLNGLVEIPPLIDACQQILHDRIQRFTDHFQVSLENALPPVRGNAQLLEQVLLNLIVNALESLPDRSRKVIVAAVRDVESGQLRLDVIDEGSGILSEDLERIRDPFFTRKAQHGGTGLGLSISESIIRNHQGRMVIHSRHGVGTRVSVFLPFLVNLP
ncbi:Adaptive-response sensory-kinase SasA [Candidatus Magnetaquicoccaceae bacterium FCR-1]|uniref:histidine kinase n=1 Tax=Candidatus Magnetaquiglobus chichijimensis TaxID=3141448 RepID=A0ABQ0C7V8_9PROT